MRTILLVDDEPVILRLFGHTLEKSGLRVLSAGNGREALETFESSEHPIDLLVTDVVMPEMDGFSLARSVLAAHPGLPVLFISAVVQSADFPGIRGSLGCRFLRKPFAPQKLLATVKDMLAAEK